MPSVANELDDKDEQPKALDEGDIALLKTYVSLNIVFDHKQWGLWFDHPKGVGPYSKAIRTIEDEIKKIAKKVNDISGMVVVLYCVVLP